MALHSTAAVCTPWHKPLSSCRRKSYSSGGSAQLSSVHWTWGEWDPRHGNQAQQATRQTKGLQRSIQYTISGPFLRFMCSSLYSSSCSVRDVFVTCKRVGVKSGRRLCDKKYLIIASHRRCRCLSRDLKFAVIEKLNLFVMRFRSWILQGSDMIFRARLRKLYIVLTTQG
jgi:hypothetical protein